MRAVVFAGENGVRLAEVPAPVLVDPTDAIVRVERASICGTDLHALAHPDHLPEGFVLGHEFAGRIVEIGSAVQGHGIGDRVVGADYTACGRCWWCRHGDHWECEQRRFFGTGSAFGPPLPGAQAELVRVPFADTVLRPVPSGLGLDAAVFLGDTLATAHAAIQRAAPRPGATVVVIGGGPVGQLTSLLAQACGAGTVILVEPVSARRELAAREGAVTATPDGARAVVDQVTSGRGADVVADAIGGAPGLEAAFGLVRRRGTVVSAGVHTGSWTLPTDQAFAGELCLRFVIGDLMRDADEIVDLVQSGAVDPTVVASETVSLDETPGAYRRMAERRTLKSLISP